MDASSLRTNSALLFCRMCQAVYRQPKLLPCLHSFCRPCLVDILTQGADGTVIVCPLCSHKTRLTPSASDVEEIPDNCFLNRMCQDYVSEVQSHLVARTLYPASTRSSSEFLALRSQLTDELSQSRYSPSPRNTSQYNSHEASRHHQEEESLRHATTTDVGSESAHSTDDAMEAICNMSRLQAKIMSLQGEALRVTYAIDHVNQCTIEWHQHKEDTKRAVERRSAQFQFFIKRMEHQLITQIYGKHVDDGFYAESDKSKTELRKILKNILHEVNVLKSIQEHGKDMEVNSLSSNLLGQSVGLVDVFLKKFHFDMNIPTQTIEDLVTECFGEIRLNSDECNVFAPEILDFTNLPMGNVTEPLGGNGFSTNFNKGRETPILEDEELDRIYASKSSQRSFSDSSSISYNPDHIVDKDDVKEHLAQFQNARETLRSRRREILSRGQQSRYDASPLRDEFQRHPRSTLRKGRVQSLDRIATPVPKKGSKTRMTPRSNKQENITDTFQGPDNKSLKQEEAASYPQPKHSITFQCGLIPSPVTEEVSFPKMSQKKLVKQSSDPHSAHGMISFPEEPSDSEMSLPNYAQPGSEQLSRTRFLDPNSGSLFTGRRHSTDQYTFVSHGEDSNVEPSHDKTTTRLMRRAISSVTDRKTKMEFLRDNWQKRKEMLIQSEGFMSPDSGAKHNAKSSTHVRSPTRSDSPSNFTASLSTSEVEYQAHNTFDDTSFGHMQQIKDSQMSYKNELANIQESNKDVMYNASSSDSMHASEPVAQRNALTATSASIPGVNRRHTIDIGETAIQKALQMTSRDTLSSNVNMPSVNQTLNQFTLADNSSTLRSSNGSDITMPSLAKSTDTARVKETNTEVMQEKTLSDQYVYSESSVAIAPPQSPSSLQTPPSATASDGVQKVRMREIARQKRERWRHLTIH